MQRELNLQKESLSSEKKKLIEAQIIFDNKMKKMGKKRSLSEEGQEFGPRGEKLLTEAKRISAPVDFSEFEFIEDDTELRGREKNTLAQSAYEVSRSRTKSDAFYKPSNRTSSLLSGGSGFDTRGVTFSAVLGPSTASFNTPPNDEPNVKVQAHEKGGSCLAFAPFGSKLASGSRPLKSR